MDINNIENDMLITDIALLMAVLDIVRCQSTVSLLPFIAENEAATRIANVTVLIPPAVPTGLPPINISKIETKDVAFVKFCCGTVANPAVLVVTDWKRHA